MVASALPFESVLVPIVVGPVAELNVPFVIDNKSG
jgi:hypothetical protein